MCQYKIDWNSRIWEKEPQASGELILLSLNITKQTNNDDNNDNHNNDNNTSNTTTNINNSNTHNDNDDNKTPTSLNITSATISADYLVIIINVHFPHIDRFSNIIIFP